jgi:hypothetical protein
MKKIKVCVGDDINVDVCAPKFGKFPIGRYQGMICKLTLPDSIKRLEYGCTVVAKVAIVNEKFLVVLVTEVIVSAAANAFKVKAGMAELATKFTKPIKKTKCEHQKLLCNGKN